MSFPSTFLDIQTAVIQKVRLDPALDSQRVKDWINQAYTRVCLETEATIGTALMNFTPNVYSYYLPAQAARVRQMQVQPVGSSEFNAPLIRTSLDELLQRRQAGGDVQASPRVATHYALLGINDFEVWPTPVSADTIFTYYVAFPAPLSANTDVPILEEPYASKLLEFGALADAGDFNGDPSTVGWQSDYADWMSRYLQHLDRKQGVIPGQFHQWGDVWVPSMADS